MAKTLTLGDDNQTDAPRRPEFWLAQAEFGVVEEWAGWIMQSGINPLSDLSLAGLRGLVKEVAAEPETDALKLGEVPAGWKLVPITPTNQMRRRLAAVVGGSWDIGDFAWEQALAVAPEPPSTPLARSNPRPPYEPPETRTREENPR